MKTALDIYGAEQRIRPFIRETDLIRSRLLSEGSGTEVLFKLETQQEIGAFKIRGAANRMTNLTAEERRAGVVAASSGNHGIGVSCMGQKLNIRTDVYVSSATASSMLGRIESYGAGVTLVDGDGGAAELQARADAQRKGQVYVSPYNDLDVVAGQGTIGLELLRQSSERPDAIFVAVGGGGLIAGIGTAIRETWPDTEVVGCWPANAPALHVALQQGGIVHVDEQPTLSTSTAGNLEPGSVTFDICRQVIDRTVLVSEEDIMRSLRLVYEDHGVVVEGAAGVAVGGFLNIKEQYAGRKVVIIVCGGNVGPDLVEAVTSGAPGHRLQNAH